MGSPERTAAAFVANPFYDEVAPHLPERLRSYYRLAYRTGDLVSLGRQEGSQLWEVRCGCWGREGSRTAAVPPHVTTTGRPNP